MYDEMLDQLMEMMHAARKVMPEIAAIQAEMYREARIALEKEGFTRDEAIQIICRQGCGLKLNQS